MHGTSVSTRRLSLPQGLRRVGLFAELIFLKRNHQVSTAHPLRERGGFFKCSEQWSGTRDVGTGD